MYATPLDGSGNHYLRSNLMVSSHYSLVYISDAACPGLQSHESLAESAAWCGHRTHQHILEDEKIPPDPAEIFNCHAIMSF
ncbi:hypothetical protein PVAP13_2KG262400 [Panicum virgatum]|uniref:Uncharacterized protein n=1 Tax=Panicum virgatum TaxID=38727 RepID=A0A8T0W3Z1_PANVG|nr:hypothetical protein PVAP13_2KG262400 [Panicum virgatum]